LLKILTIRNSIKRSLLTYLASSEIMTSRSKKSQGDGKWFWREPLNWSSLITVEPDDCTNISQRFSILRILTLFRLYLCCYDAWFVHYD